MSTYGMKDAANLTLVDRVTKKPILHIDYANATSTEWTSERVYAKKKNVNAIAFDSGKQGVLTLEDEIFDLKLLSVIMGSELEEGDSDIFKKERLLVSANKQLKLSHVPEAGSVSVFKLKRDGLEHDGGEVPAKVTGEKNSVPVMPVDVAVSAKDTSATITWSASKGADTYVVFRNGAQVGTVSTTSFDDTDLTPEHEYKYTVKALNVNGQSPLSAEVVVTTAVSGTDVAGAVVKATEQAIKEAEEVATANASQGLNYEILDNGVIQLSDAASEGAKYAVYYTTHVDHARTITVAADKFPKAFEIYADALLREAETGNDEFMQIHYFNARPQGNFTFQQSSKEPTNLSIKFDLFPNEDNELATYKVVE